MLEQIDVVPGRCDANENTKLVDRTVRQTRPKTAGSFKNTRLLRVHELGLGSGDTKHDWVEHTHPTHERPELRVPAFGQGARVIPALVGNATNRVHRPHRVQARHFGPGGRGLDVGFADRTSRDMPGIRDFSGNGHLVCGKRAADEALDGVCCGVIEHESAGQLHAQAALQSVAQLDGAQGIETCSHQGLLVSDRCPQHALHGRQHLIPHIF